LLNFWLQVDSANKYGTLLEVVQMLTDLKLTIGPTFEGGSWMVCRATTSFPVIFQKFKKTDERKMVPFWGDAKPRFCLGCDLSILLFISNPDV